MSKMHFSLFLLPAMLVSLLASQPAHAIINAEGLGTAQDKEGLNGRASLSASGNSGNSNTFSGEAGARLAWKHGRQDEILVGSYAYGKSNGQRDTNKSFLHLRHRHALDDPMGIDGLAVEAFVQAQQNEFARLKLRTLAGGGLRYSTPSDGWRFDLGLGSFFENEILRSTAANPNPPRSRLWRGNAYMTLHYEFNDRVRLNNTVYYQPAWKQVADYRLLESAGMGVSLTDTLELRLSLDIEKDSRPPAGVKVTDTSYRTGLEYRF